MENKDIIRGSIWRKWDLQIHTPFSYLNNQFGDNFDNYVKNVFKKALENNIFAIGITDYFCVEGYKKIKNEYLTSSKLKELSFTDEEIKKIQKILILPNIEFRLNKLVGTNRINFHVIFSSDVSIQDIEKSTKETSKKVDSVIDNQLVSTFDFTMKYIKYIILAVLGAAIMFIVNLLNIYKFTYTIVKKK